MNDKAITAACTQAAQKGVAVKVKQKITAKPLSRPVGGKR